LKCYVHPDVDAVGVCSSCGRGVCRACAVKVGGKIYCTEDADQLYPKTVVLRAIGRQAPKRGFGVVVGSIFSYILGGIAAVISFLLIYDSMVAPSSGGASGFFSILYLNLSFLGRVQGYSSGSTLNLGIGLLIFGCLGIAAGLIMWRPSRVGAVVSVVFGVIGLAAAFELASISASPLLVDAWFAFSGLTMAFSIIGFLQLTRRRG
jgi:hypothetical protein